MATKHAKTFVKYAASILSSFTLILLTLTLFSSLRIIMEKDNSHAEQCVLYTNAPIFLSKERQLKSKEEFLQNFRTFPVLESTVENENNVIPVITNPTSNLLVVNKERSLPYNFKPDDLVIPDVPFPFSGEHEKKYLRKEAAEALEKMFQAAKEEDIHLYAVSGFRSFERQQVLYRYYVATMGEEEAKRASAYLGTSEHQTGLAMDISSQSNNFELTQQFGETKEGKWVEENAHRFGFIIRYPKDKEEITGYKYEPWHLRYVGIDAATFLTENKLTLEEVSGKRY